MKTLQEFLVSSKISNRERKFKIYTRYNLITAANVGYVLVNNKEEYEEFVSGINPEGGISPIGNRVTNALLKNELPKENTAGFIHPVKTDKGYGIRLQCINYDEENPLNSVLDFWEYKEAGSLSPEDFTLDYWKKHKWEIY